MFKILNPVEPWLTLSVQILVAANVAAPAAKVASPNEPVVGDKVLLNGYSAIKVCPNP